MDWTKVVTDPLGLAGFALSAVVGIVGRLITPKRKKKTHWIVPGAYVLAAVCILGGLALAYQHASSAVAAKSYNAAPTPSMRIDKIDQKVNNGAAVAGVQGNVTVNNQTPQKQSKPK